VLWDAALNEWQDRWKGIYITLRVSIANTFYRENTFSPV
jgi:hypothetical protein